MTTTSPALTVDQLRTQVRRRRPRHRHRRVSRHAGPAPGQAVPRPVLPRPVLEHGTEGCNYLLAVDVDMNTVDGYAISSWERGYGDMELVPDLATLPAAAVAARHRDGPVRPGLAGRRPLPGGREPRGDPHATRSRRPPRRGWSPWPAPSSSSWSSTTPTSRPGTTPTAGSPRRRVQRGLLAARHQPGRAAAARHPQRDVRRGVRRRVGQGRVQPRAARDRVPLRRGACAPPTSTRSTRTAPRRSPPCRARRSPTWRSSTSARATPATST